jgi:hypothetical protein
VLDGGHRAGRRDGEGHGGAEDETDGGHGAHYCNNSNNST